MQGPIIFDVKPVAVELEPGKDYYWCSCGRSAGQPFRDGSHASTSLTPKEFSVDTVGEVHNFFAASRELMQVMARACGHHSLAQFCAEDITTWKRGRVELTGIGFAGVWERYS